MFDPSSSTNVFDDRLFVRMKMLWNQLEDGIPNDLLRGVAEDPCGSVIPTGDNAIQVFAHNHIVRGRHDRCKFTKTLRTLSPFRFGLPNLRNITNRAQNSASRALCLGFKISVDLDTSKSPVRAIHQPFKAERLAPFQRVFHGLSQGIPIVRVHNLAYEGAAVDWPLVPRTPEDLVHSVVLPASVVLHRVPDKDSQLRNLGRQLQSSLTFTKSARSHNGLGHVAESIVNSSNSPVLINRN